MSIWHFNRQQNDTELLAVLFGYRPDSCYSKTRWTTNNNDRYKRII